MGKSPVFLVAKNLQTSRKCPDSFNCAKGQKMKFIIERSQQDFAHNREQFTSVWSVSTYGKNNPGIQWLSALPHTQLALGPTCNMSQGLKGMVLSSLMQRVAGTYSLLHVVSLKQTKLCSNMTMNIADSLKTTITVIMSDVSAASAEFSGEVQSGCRPGVHSLTLERFLQLPEQELQTLESAGGWSQTLPGSVTSGQVQNPAKTAGEITALLKTRRVWSGSVLNEHHVLLLYPEYFTQYSGKESFDVEESSIHPHQNFVTLAFFQWSLNLSLLNIWQENLSKGQVNIQEEMNRVDANHSCQALDKHQQHLSKTIFAQYCIHLDELSFKMLEKFLYLNAILTIKDQVKSAGKDTAQYEYKQDALTICQALNVIFIPQMLWGILYDFTRDLSGEDKTNNSMVSDGFTDILLVKTYNKNSASYTMSSWLQLFG
ncbi:hypothetical protein Anapl_01325 [Anas platyrhynchos]|uniref:Uncharacterized protein n=1 Tax=Anas platyrhynchos TaxID=8839 RepID=R0LYF6_ANAPL|nr:hypothetical protein Anapl_01325 [Anas platyrhynchos]